MPSIVYLDPEDEITTAATRIRQAPEKRVALVVPFGSRVATSRINFRLLAREAMRDGRRLDIVAPDASARALAASAGIPVFASVGEYEAALDIPAHVPEPDTRRFDPAVAGTAAVAAAAAGAAATGAVPGHGSAAAAGTAAGAGTATPGAAAGSLPAGAVAGFASAGGASAPAPDPVRDAELDAIVHRSREAPEVRTPRRRIPAALVAGVLLLIVALGVAGVAAYLFLPAATITLIPRIQPVGPIGLTVTADPAATSVDADALVIPAQSVEIPAQASGTFQATGKRVEKTAATGGVRWRNCDPTASYTIPKGSIVRTSGGTAFSIDEAVFLPVAIISGGGASVNLKCQSSEVAVTATDKGTAGNVDAGTIRVVPSRYNRTVISVTNPSATTGGTETTIVRISKKDVDAALASLQVDLKASFETEVGNPDRVPPGSTAFPETAVLGEATPTVDPTTLVNQEVETFDLGLDATGTMLAVDPSPIEGIAAARLGAEVTPGSELVEGSTRIAVGDGTVSDGIVTFQATAMAKETRPVDGPALEGQVLGLSEAEAHAVLDPYGETTIELWPGFVTSVPTLDQRVTLTVGQPVEVAP